MAMSQDWPAGCDRITVKLIMSAACRQRPTEHPFAVITPPAWFQLIEVLLDGWGSWLITVSIQAAC